MQAMRTSSIRNPATGRCWFARATTIAALFLVIWTSQSGGAAQARARLADTKHSHPVKAAKAHKKTRPRKSGKAAKDEYVFIGAIPGEPEIGEKVARAFHRSGIEPGIDGSKSYGIIVKKSEQDKAVAILGKLARDKKLRIQLCKPYRVSTGD